MCVCGGGGGGGGSLLDDQTYLMQNFHKHFPLFRNNNTSIYDKIDENPEMHWSPERESLKPSRGRLPRKCLSGRVDYGETGKSSVGY